jgi:hypothetical protein
MKDKPWFRAAVCARFQEYIAPPPHAQARPAPVKRPEHYATIPHVTCGHWRRPSRG